MELYILDDSFRRTKVIDTYESLIWTERFDSFGDFELIILSNLENRTILISDTKLGLNLSYRVMVIETIENKKDDDGRSLLTIKGRSLEAILLDRVAKNTLTQLGNISKGAATITIATPGVVTNVGHLLTTGDAVYFTTTGALPTGLLINTVYYVIQASADTFYLSQSYADALDSLAIITSGSQSGVHTLIQYNSGTWTIAGTPGDVARDIFDAICVDGINSASDIIPMYDAATLFAADTLVEDAVVRIFDFKPTTVYDILKTILEPYDMGFRLYRGLDDQKVYFDVYVGSDRTTQQTVLAPVVFSPSYDNLSDTVELTSIALYKNIAHVFGENGSLYVYAPGADASTSGFKRRVLYVDASDITTAAGAQLNSELLLRGQQALAENRSFYAFDGLIPQNSRYTYMVHYNLGDLVENRNEDGLINSMKVTEQIFVSDALGERSYPTLTSKLLITPGSWLASEPGLEWDEVPDSDYWDTI